MGTVALLAGVGVLVVSSRVSSEMPFGQEGLQRSVGQLLERGEPDTDRIVIELTGEELTEVLTDGIGGVSVDDLTVRIEGADRPSRGRLHIAGRDGGSGAFRGRAAVEVVAGRLQVEMEELELGGRRLPGFAHAVAGDLFATSIEPFLEEQGVQLRDVTFADDLLRIVVAQPDGRSATSDGPDRADAGRAAAGAGGDGPAALSRVPPGTADAPVVAGEPAVLVLGDSVAAGVGVDDFADSYAARVHGWLERRDDADYGLHNVAVPGETSRSLREDGQLDRALAALDDSEAALIVVDIGANDVLSALHHPACEDDLVAPDCSDLIDSRLADLPALLGATLADLREAAPRAPLVVVTTYNPFSLGGTSDFERRTDEVVDDLNGVIRRVGRAHGARIAHGATPLKGRAAELTHMAGDGPPDVHPTADGYDELASAVVDALRRPPRVASLGRDRSGYSR